MSTHKSTNTSLDSLFDYRKSNVISDEISVETKPKQRRTKSEKSLTREKTREKQRLQRQQQQEKRRQKQVPASSKRKIEEIGEYERHIIKRRAENRAFLEALKINEIKDQLIDSIQKLKPKMKRKAVKRPIHVGPVRRSARLQSKKRPVYFEDENEQEQYASEIETAVSPKLRKVPASDSDSDVSPIKRTPGSAIGMKRKMVIYSSDDSDEVPPKRKENDNVSPKLRKVPASDSESSDSDVSPIKRRHGSAIGMKRKMVIYSSDDSDEVPPKRNENDNVIPKLRKVPASDSESSDSDVSPIKRRHGSAIGMKRKMVIYSSDDSDEVPPKRHENDNASQQEMSEEVSAVISEDEAEVKLNMLAPEQLQEALQIPLTVNEDTGSVVDNDSSVSENAVFRFAMRKLKGPVRPRDELGRYIKNQNSQPPRMRKTNRHFPNELEKLTSSKLLGVCLTDSFLNCPKSIAERTRSRLNL